MKTKIIEVTNGPRNWGKFLIGVLDVEWQRRSAIVPDDQILMANAPLLRQIGMSPSQVLVLDLQTCEGALFQHGGLAKYDLNNHRVWVCPLFEPFLTWLYDQPRDKVLALELPESIDLPDVPFAMSGYRREGPKE